MNSTRKPEIVRQQFLAMGTQITVTVMAEDDARGRTAAATAISEVDQAMNLFGRDWWAWGDGVLAALNRRLAAGEVVEIPSDMQALFVRAWQIREKTGGRYEPRIASLVHLWGFDEMARLRSEPPAANAIAELLAALRAAPAYDGGNTYGPAPKMGWDFGGIGKGYIVDAMLDQLRLRGFANAIVDAGGNLAARGRRGERPWHIGIRDPQSSPLAPKLLASLDVHDESVNTHGDDQRFFDFEGRRYAHLLDPTLGAPAQGLRSLTVVHADATRAEAEGAALFVAGPSAWRALAAEWGIDQVLAVPETGAVQVTAALASRLHPQPGVPIEVLP